MKRTTRLKRKTRLRSVSKKRRKINEEYMRLREMFFIRHPFCQVWIDAEQKKMPEYTTEQIESLCKTGLISAPRATDIHHMKGRGKYLCDTSTWMAVSRSAHRFIHDHPKESREKGYILPP